MGAGAGYNISGMIDSDTIKINSFEVAKPYTETEDYGSGYSMDYQLIPIKCDIDCAVEDIYCESYMYGGTLHGLTPIKITEMELIPYADIEDISEINEEAIWYALRDLKFKARIGGGWSHTKFDGDISCDIHDLDVDDYSDFYFNSITMQITNAQAIEVIDEYVSGENYVDEYRVVDEYDETMEDYFEDFESAVAYAEENNGYEVLSQRTWYTYELANDGYTDVYDIDVDFDSLPEWTNPNYIEEDF